jgi:hypothetical protein
MKNYEPKLPEFIGLRYVPKVEWTGDQTPPFIEVVLVIMKRFHVMKELGLTAIHVVEIWIGR